MSTPDSRPDLDPRIGLCSVCQHARIIKHPRGGTFYAQCTVAEKDATFDKYPRVPVLKCTAFAQSTPADK